MLWLGLLCRLPSNLSCFIAGFIPPVKLLFKRPIISIIA